MPKKGDKNSKNGALEEKLPSKPLGHGASQVAGCSRRPVLKLIRKRLNFDNLSECSHTVDENVGPVLRPRKRARQERVEKPLIPINANTDESAKEASFQDDDDGHLNFNVGDTINRRYNMLGILGKGTFGRVAKAFDIERGQLVALKIERSVAVVTENAVSEVEILKKIAEIDSQGKNLWVKMLDSFLYHGHVCISFELLGSSLFDFLKENKFQPFPLDHVRHIMYQLCYSINLLHEHGITHTDLKTENVVFVNSGFTVSSCVTLRYRFRTVNNTEIRVIDFGSAVWEDEFHGDRIQTRHYRAPEVFAGLKWDTACDVWSIGCIFFELYTGNVLFPTTYGNEHLAMMERILGPLPPKYAETRAIKTLIGEGSGYTGRNIRSRCKPLKKYMSGNSKEHVDAFNLMEKMLTYHLEERIPLIAALEHPFFAKLPIEKRL